MRLSRSALLGASLSAPLLTGLLLASPTAFAQTSVLGGPPLRACKQQNIELAQGTSTTIDFGTDIRDASVTNPKTADIRNQTSRRFLVMGGEVGRTDATFYDVYNQCSLMLNIRVTQDTDGLDELISFVAPGARVQTKVVGNTIILSGQVTSVAEADRVLKAAQRYVAKPEQVLNYMISPDSDQVMLNVQVVEVNRTVIKQLGFDTQALFGQLGGDQFSFGSSPSYAVNSGFQGGGAGTGYVRNTTKQPVVARDRIVPMQVYDSATGTYHIEYQLKTYDVIDPTDLLSVPKDSIGSDAVNQAKALIQSFERDGLVRTLAETNLTSVSGEAAKYLAGGEYPVPSGRDNQGNTIIEFKPYGVGLGFTPVVLAGGRISLKVSIEVSELSTQGAATLAGVAGAGSSTIIPALTVNRTQNVVELPSGGSMMIAGLLREQTRQNIDKDPALANLPIFGALARSRDFLKTESELVVIVTPYLVNPTSPGQLQTPADGLRIASDAETNLLGRLNHAYKAAPGDPPTALAGRRYEGPLGHVID